MIDFSPLGTASFSLWTGSRDHCSNVISFFSWPRMTSITYGEACGVTCYRNHFIDSHRDRSHSGRDQGRHARASVLACYLVRQDEFTLGDWEHDSPAHNPGLGTKYSFGKTFGWQANYFQVAILNF